MQNTLTAAAVMLITSSQAINTKQAVTQNRALLAQTNQDCGSILYDASGNARNLADNTVGSIQLTAAELQQRVVQTYNQTKVSIQKAVQDLEETVQNQIDSTVASVNSDLKNLKFAIEGVAGEAADDLDAAGCLNGCQPLPSPQVFLVDIPLQQEPVAYVVENVDPTQPASIFVSQGQDNSDSEPSIVVQQPSDGSAPVVIVNDQVVDVVIIGSNDSTPAVVTVGNETSSPDTYVVSDATDENPTVSVLLPNVDVSFVEISVTEALQVDSNASSNDDQNSESNDDSQQNINVWWPITNDNGEVVATGDSNGVQNLETYENVEVPTGEETPAVYQVDSGAAASDPIVYTYTDVDGSTAYVVDSADQNATINIVQGSDSDSDPVVLVDEVEIVPIPIDISTNPYIVVASDQETDVPNTYIVADDETIQEVDTTPVLQVVSANDTTLDSSSDVLNTFTAVFNSDGDFDSVIINNTTVTPDVYDNVSYGNLVVDPVPEPVVIELDVGASEPVVFVSYPTDETQAPTYYIDNASNSDATVTIEVSGDQTVVTVDDVVITPVDISDVVQPAIYVTSGDDIYVADLAFTDNDGNLTNVYALASSDDDQVATASGSDSGLTFVDPVVVEDVVPDFVPVTDPINDQVVSVSISGEAETEPEIVADVTVYQSDVEISTQVYSSDDVTVEPIVIAIDLESSDPVVLVSYASSPDEPDVYYVSNGNDNVDTVDSSVTVDVTDETPVFTIDNVEVTPVDITDVIVPSVYVNTDGDVFVADLADVDSDENPVVYALPSESDQEIVQVDSQVIEDIEPVFTPIIDPIENVPIAYVDESGDTDQVEVVEDVTVVADVTVVSSVDSGDDTVESPAPIIIAIETGSSEPVILVQYASDPEQPDVYYIDNGSSNDDVTVDTTGQEPVVTIGDEVVTAVDISIIESPAVVVATDGTVYVADNEDLDSDDNPVVYEVVANTDSDQESSLAVVTSSVDISPESLPTVYPDVTIISPPSDEDSSEDNQVSSVETQSESISLVEPVVIEMDIETSSPVVLVSYATSPDEPDVYYIHNANSENDNVDSQVTVDYSSETPVILIDDVEITPVDITDVVAPSVYVNTDGDVFVADLEDVDSDENPVVYIVPTESDQELVQVDSSEVAESQPAFTPILDPIDNVPFAVVDSTGNTTDADVVADIIVVSSEDSTQTVEPIVIAIDLETSDPVVLVSYATTPDQPDVYYVSNGNDNVDTVDSQVSVDYTSETPVVTIDNVEVTPVDITDVIAPSVYVNTDGDVFVADLEDVDSDENPVVYILPSESDQEIVQVDSQVIEDIEPVFTPIIDPIENVPIAYVDESGDTDQVEVVEDVTVFEEEVSSGDDETQTVEPIVIAINLETSEPVVLVSYATTPDQPDVYYVSNGITNVDSADSSVQVDVTYETPVVTVDNVEVTPVDITELIAPSVYVNTDGDVFVADLADVDSDQNPVVYALPSESDQDIVQVDSYAIEDIEPVFTPILDPIDNVPIAVVDESGETTDVAVVEDVTVIEEEVSSGDDETQTVEPIVIAIDLETSEPVVLVSYATTSDQPDVYYVSNGNDNVYTEDSQVSVDYTSETPVVTIDNVEVTPVDITELIAPSVYVNTDGNVFVADLAEVDSDQNPVVYVLPSESDQDIVQVDSYVIEFIEPVFTPIIDPIENVPIAIVDESGETTDITVVEDVTVVQSYEEESETESYQAPVVLAIDIDAQVPTVIVNYSDVDTYYIDDAGTGASIVIDTTGESTVVFVDNQVVQPIDVTDVASPAVIVSTDGDVYVVDQASNSDEESVIYVAISSVDTEQDLIEVTASLVDEDDVVVIQSVDTEVTVIAPEVEESSSDDQPAVVTAQLGNDEPVVYTVGSGSEESPVTYVVDPATENSNVEIALTTDDEGNTVVVVNGDIIIPEPAPAESDSETDFWPVYNPVTNEVVAVVTSGDNIVPVTTVSTEDSDFDSEQAPCEDLLSEAEQQIADQEAEIAELEAQLAALQDN